MTRSHGFSIGGPRCRRIFGFGGAIGPCSILWTVLATGLPAACGQSATEVDAQTGQIIGPSTRPAGDRRQAPATADAEPLGASVSTAVPAAVRPFELIVPGAHLFDDWGGMRTALDARGITPTFSLVTDVAGNPTGGLRRGVTEASNLGLDVQFNLGKLAGLTGGSFLLSMSDRFGNSLSDDYVGNAFNVQQDFGGETFRVIDAAYRQRLAGDHLEFRVGRVAAGDDFFVCSYDYLFMQNGVDGNPVGVFFNSPGMTAYPNATWGGSVKMTPTPRGYVMAGLYNGDPTIRANVHHGVDLSLNGPLFAIAEAGYQTNGLPGDRGLTGNYKVGLWYDDGRFDEFRPAGQSGAAKRGNTGFYAIADQAVIPFGDPRGGRGLGVFGSVLVSPDESVSTLPYFFTAGVAARGLLASRPDDAFGLAVVYGRFSEELRDAERAAPLSNVAVGPQGDETAIELTCRGYVGRGGVFLQPDLQYIVHPYGSGRISNAVVLGCQVGINF
jgi:porin